MVIVVFHGGNEHAPIPSPDTVDRYKFICDMGADAVIGGHTHCPQGYEIYDDKPIVYSMGNFFFPKNLEKNNHWYFGYMCELTIDKKIDLKTVPYRYDNENKIFIDLSNDEKFTSYLKLLSDTVTNKNFLKICFDKWAVMHPWCPTLNDGTENYNPYASYDIVSCEAHLSQLKAFLKLQCDNDDKKYESEEVENLYNFDYF